MMIAGVKIPCIGGGFRVLNDFRELSFCGPFGPCFEIFRKRSFLASWFRVSGTPLSFHISLGERKLKL